MGKIFLSIVGYIDNEAHFEFFCNSVKNQSLSKENLELIFVDSLYSKDCEQLANTLKSEGYVVKYFKEIGISEENAYFFACKEINGIYANFSRTSSYFSKNSLKPSLFKNNTLKSFKPVFVNSNGKEGLYKACPKKVLSKNINLLKNSYDFQLHLGAYLIPSECLKKITFKTELGVDTLYRFIIDVLACYKNFKLLNSNYYYTHALEDNPGVAEIQHNKSWYSQSLTNFLIPTVKEFKNTNFVQNICFYLLLSKYNCNLFNRNKGVLNSEEVMAFEKLTSEFLQYIEDNGSIFENRKLYNFTRSFNIYLTKLKYQLYNNYQVVIKDNCFYYSFRDKDILIGSLKDEKVIIELINYDNNNLIIDGVFCSDEFLEGKSFKAYAELNGQKYPLVRNNTYPENYSFGVPFYKKYRFSIFLPSINRGDIKFFLEYNDRKIPMQISSAGAFCRINTIKNSYWHYSKNCLYYKKTKNNGDALKIRRSNVFVNFYKEIYAIIRNMVVKKFSKKSIIASGFRVVYWLTRPLFYKRHIWLYYDKLYKAGDNAEYLFHYANAQNDNIEHYYIVNNTSPDYNRLKTADKDRILVFNSIKAKLYALNAECVLATHANVMGFLGFPRKSHSFFTNLYKLKVVCVQHGLTIQQIAVHQNRLVDNTRLYCCASKFEIDNLNQDVYGYFGDELKLVGLARYDGLKNNDKKQILITPTWRKECARGDSQMGSARKYNELFKTTEYFRLYNSLINDKKLIETAKKCNYRLIYLLHPVVSSQIEDFTKNDYVEILAASGNMSYEKILTESSLMVTDYSGVQFDFAYQRKPIVYYHPSTLPPHYDEGCGFMYDSMGFGSIITEHNALVDELCDYMENECKIKPEYAKRADNFFAYSDFDNCKRIYNEVINFIK